MAGILSRFVKVGAVLIFVRPSNRSHYRIGNGYQHRRDSSWQRWRAIWMAAFLWRRPTPLTIAIAANDKDADYLLTSTSIGANDRWHSVVFDKKRNRERGQRGFDQGQG